MLFALSSLVAVAFLRIRLGVLAARHFDSLAPEQRERFVSNLLRNHS